VTVPEISDIRGVDSSGVIATLLDRKLITTAGRKAVIGRPILYKTSKEFLLRFGLKDVHELPSMEEFEKLLAESFQSDLIPGEAQPEPTSSDPTSESEAELPAVDDSANEPPEPASQADGVAETQAAETDYSAADTSSGDAALEEKRNAS
jgi:segregation and condensation protein B